MTVALQQNYDETIRRVTEALKTEGFGVLTEIDVTATLKQKLDIDFRPYRILGACNPRLAYRALSAAPDVGLLLPCNVTITPFDEGTTQVTIVNPLAMMSVIADDALKQVAQEAHERLSRVIAALAA
ncbi:MAG: DUF302 domain-containing protein [Anaerolineae bacterium]|nr:DUF302 domain-containing protein [Anaerolineae bacterium]